MKNENISLLSLKIFVGVGVAVFTCLLWVYVNKSVPQVIIIIITGLLLVIIIILALSDM